ncbi:MAG TPA: hypothetical protein VGN52_23610 [Burkholderiales bacterium]|jgi:hypothetical protein
MTMAALALGAGASARAELDLSLFRAASCGALVNEYAAVRDVNPAVLKEMRRADNATTIDAGAAGVAEMAAPGLRAALSRDHASDETALAELAAYRQAIVTVAEEKKCALPGSGPGPASTQ